MTNKNTIDLTYLRNIKAVVRLQGRDYLTHSGLLRVAHEHGLKSLRAELLHWDPESWAAVTLTTAEGERGVYTAHGDASPENVAKHLKTATLRMAETRAANRALRFYTGLGMTTTEELPGDRDAGEEPPSPRRGGAVRAPTMVDTQAIGCAACGELVSGEQARSSEATTGAVLCEAHLDVWEQPDDASFDNDVALDFEARVEALGLEMDALRVRCVASPQWGKRPGQMTSDERERLLIVLQQHHDRKAGEGK